MSSSLLPILFLPRHASIAFSSLNAVLAPDVESRTCPLFGLRAIPSPSAESDGDAACRTPKAVPLSDHEPAPCAECVPLMEIEAVPPPEIADPSPCLLPVAEVEIASQAAQSLPSNNGYLPPRSAFRSALPSALAFRCQPISPPGKSNIVAILKKRELDSKKKSRLSK